MSVEIKRYGVIHYQAACEYGGCNWTDAWGDGRSFDAIRMAAKRHVEKTGHEVTIEAGTSTSYMPNTQ